MAAQAPLQAQAQFEDLRTDQAFMAAPPVEQIQYLMQDYLPKQDPEFAKAPEPERMQYIQEAVMPQLGIKPAPIQGPERPQVVEAPRWADYNPMSAESILKDLGGSFLSNAAGAAKGLSFGHLDFTQPAEDFSRGFGARYYNPDIAAVGGELAGGIGSGAALERAGMAGLQGAGRFLLPRTTQMAEAAGQAIPGGRQILQGISQLQSKELLPTMARFGASGAAYGGLTKPEEGESRLGNAAIGGALGAALPVAGAAGKKVLRGGVQAYRELMSPPDMPVGFAKQARESTQKAIYDQLQTLSSTLGKIQRGEIDPALIDADDYAELVTKIDELAKAYKTAKPVQRLSSADTVSKKIQIKAKARAEKAGRSVEKTQNKQQDGPKQQAPENKAVAETPATKPEEKALTGKVEETAEKQPVDLPDNAGTFTAGQLEKQLGRKLTTDEKDIHANMRAVARAEVVDAGRGIHRQLPLSERTLKYDDVKDSVSPEYQKTAEAIDNAMVEGKVARIEYDAEIAGRSNEAAKLTKAGNVKVEVTDFTPTHWSKTKDGKVLAHGYNQRGHFTTYHLEPSPEGSQILKAKASTKAGFVGEYPNVYRGQQTFLAKDVLGRGVRSAEGPVKTSDAINMMEEVANNLDKVFKLIDDPKMPKQLREMLTELRDKPKWTQKDLKRLTDWLNKPELKTAICNILGLKHG